MDRAHRALRPKSATSKPRDIICRISSYPLKEIVRQARLARKVTFADVQIQLYPDLSWITLQKRRLFQPLLHTLQDENIPYRWGFPFSLTAKRQCKSAALRYPEDLAAFCDTLEIPAPQLPVWDLLATPPPPPTVWQKELIPLILCTACLHPEPKERDQLLHILFNLIKRPDDEQRQMILTGCVAFARHVGPTRVEAELLPQCWEQPKQEVRESSCKKMESLGDPSGY
ncbi:hypothetical protein AB205_0124000 [Aquarana catesbeiana]|uniref:Uncharacterized protein n=1 Tax=Aquarana catesbeiana TaxID=8400 RepID=A0A2G9RU93_AQUCT|nr:hypothetical protein AB205_0124000 [Aquarana catesbeiana]